MGHVRELLAGELVDWHQHDTDQLTAPASGVIFALTPAGAWVVPSPARALYLPAGLPHAHRAHNRTTLLTLSLPSSVSCASRVEPHVITVSPLLRELLHVLTRQPSADPARHGRLMAVVADELAVTPKPALILPQPNEARLRMATKLLAADPTCTSSELAAEIGTSTRTLSRLAREEIGLTIPQWRTRHRLAASLALLTDGTPVTTTAHRCGWNSISTFIAAFHSVIGITPGAYVRSLRPGSGSWAAGAEADLATPQNIIPAPNSQQNINRGE